MKMLIVLGLVLFSLASCALFEHKETSDIRGRWVLESYRFGRGEAFTIPSDDVYTFDFETDGDLNALGASCNNCEGTYSADSDGSFSAVVSCTEAACDALPTYGHSLNDAVSYELDNDTLYITFEQSREVGLLSFSRLK